MSPLLSSPIAPLPQHTPPGLPLAPSRPGGCEGIREPGSSREGQQSAEAKQAEASRKPRTAGMNPTSPCRGGTIPQISHPIFISPLPTSPSPVTCLGGSVVKNLPANAGDTSWIPGLGRSPGGGNGNPLQYSSQEDPSDSGAWQAAVHGVAKSQTRLSEHAHLGQIKHRILESQRPGFKSQLNHLLSLYNPWANCDYLRASSSL